MPASFLWHWPAQPPPPIKSITARERPDLPSPSTTEGATDPVLALLLLLSLRIPLSFCIDVSLGVSLDDALSLFQFLEPGTQ